MGPPRSSSVPARVLWYMGGCLVSAVCFVVTVRTELGLGPLFVVQDGLHRVLGVSLGQSVMLVGTVLVVAARSCCEGGSVSAPLRSRS